MIKPFSFIISLLLCSPLLFAQGFIEQTKKSAFDRHADDYLGLIVDISGDYAIAGCHSNDYDANGSNFRSQSGAAFIFERDSTGSWYTRQKLVASDRRANDVYGLHVAIDGKFAVVGAYGHDYNASGSGYMETAGAAYIYERKSNGQWIQVQKIVASDRTTGNYFGYAVEIQGDFILVAAPRNSTDASGGNSRSEAGACYLFKRDTSGTWSQIQKLVASDRTANNRFGESSLCISGSYLAIGAHLQRTDKNGNNSLTEAGAAYVFEEDSTGTWNEVTKLVASDRQANARFGGRVSLDSNILGVNAIFETKDTSGANSIYRAGAVYFFDRDSSGNWNEVQKVVASDRAYDDWFGLSVSLSNGYALIGATNEDHDENGADSVTDAGSAYVFRRNSSGFWVQIQKIVASDRSVDDHFGRLSLSGKTAIVGSRWQETDSAGKNSVTDAGAVYIFTLCYPGADSITASACDKYTSPSGNHIWDSSGWYIDTLRNAEGCDSFLYIDLTVTKPQAFTHNVSDCYSFTTPDSMHTWTTSGSYLVEFNCDSFVVYNVTIHGRDSQELQIYACNSFESPTGKYTWTQSGLYRDTFTNVKGCDSIIVVDLTVSYTSYDTTYVESCESYVSPSGNYTWFNDGVYQDTINNVSNCDSVITINLTIHHSTTGTDLVTACDSFTWIDGAVYYDDNDTSTYVLTNSHNCDSIVTLNLTINRSNTGTDWVTACDTYTWINGITYSTNISGAKYTIPTTKGCDSIVTLMLTINKSNSGTDVMEACDSFTWINGITYYTSNNSATHLLANNNGCDSLVRLNLKIKNSSSRTDVIKACDSYTWVDGITYYSSNNTSKHILTNANGCDSVIHLNLTIHNSDARKEVVTACDSFTWINGVTYYASNNTARYGFTNKFGCDSVVTLDLTINKSSHFADVVTSCDSFTWINGKTYYSNNQSALFKLTNSSGCDSIISLDLTITNKTMYTDVAEACDSFTWIDGNTYYQSTNAPFHKLVNTLGCDSIIYLNLTILKPSAGNINAHTCDEYVSPSGRFVWSNPGIYTDTLVNAVGCDSILLINLQVTHIDTSVSKDSATLTANETDATYRWISCDGLPVDNEISTSYTPQSNGRYAVEITKNGCVDTSSCFTIDHYKFSEVNHETICSMIFPNPTNRAFTVDVGRFEQIHSITLYDLNGKEVRTFTYVPQSSVDVDMDWQSAVYIVKIVTGKGAFYCKMVVQR